MDQLRRQNVNVGSHKTAVMSSFKNDGIPRELFLTNVVRQMNCKFCFFFLFFFDCFSLRKQSQGRHIENILAFVEILLNCPVCAAAETSSFKITVSLNVT